ncbi:hypothetical protein WG66_004625 [Moniliophthora roreri]|nr:hypothetical protein WG66_004625 [Moniliophthora roreri]
MHRLNISLSHIGHSGWVGSLFLMPLIGPNPNPRHQKIYIYRFFVLYLTLCSSLTSDRIKTIFVAHYYHMQYTDWQPWTLKLVEPWKVAVLYSV